MIGNVDLRTLSRAVVAGDAQVISRFLDHGGNPSLGERGYSLLHEAVYCKQKAIMKLLLDAGANVNQEDQDGLTPLHYVFSYPVEQLPPMVVGGSFKSFAPGPRVSRDPALQHDILSMLLVAGAEVNPVKKTSDISYGQMVSFKTPLIEAAGAGNVAAVRLLLQYKADANVTDFYDASALITAANNGHPGVVKALIEAGANINAHQRFGNTPLMRAIYYSRTAIMLLETSSKQSSPAPDPVQLRQATESIQLRYRQVVEVLLNANADLEADDEHGRTALFACINECNKAYLQQVLAAGASVHHRDKDGNEPLHFLVKVLKSRKMDENEMASLARILIEAGANSESKDVNGQTPLQLAGKENLTLISKRLSKE
jgi:ankyrin repeat protein